MGAHLLNHLQGPAWSVTYWRHGGEEVDFVVSHGTETWAIEVKSGRHDKPTGLAAFRKRYPASKVLLVGGYGDSAGGFRESTGTGVVPSIGIATGIAICRPGRLVMAAGATLLVHVSGRGEEVIIREWY